MVGNLTWNANGSLQTLAITDGFNSGGTETCTYAHDDMGRASSATCVNGSTNVWGQTFSYDPFSNITKQVPTGDTGVSWMPGYNLNNHYTLSGTSYDPNGNVLKDTFHTYTWDATAHPATIDATTCGTSGTCLTYDAMGRMVEKSVGSTFTEVLYSPVGRTAIMAGQTLNGYRVSLPGGLTFSGNSSNANIYYPDWLGSVRLASGFGNRAVSVDRAFASFGETYAGVTNPSSDPDFTGDHQDVIAGLYDTDNRELHPTQGR
jgi:hypothetical protein